jgi:hypothetical protein
MKHVPSGFLSQKKKQTKKRTARERGQAERKKVAQR